MVVGLYFLKRNLNFRAGVSFSVLEIMAKESNLELLQNFCDESSIHGIQYLAPSRGYLKRCLWILLLVVAFTLAGGVVHSLIENWNDNPIVTTFSTTNYPVQKILFPSITVCPNQYDPWAFVQR